MMCIPASDTSRSPLLFVRGGALGDFVLTMPVLAAMFASGKRVDVVCAKRHLPLVALCGTPGKTYDIDGSDSAWNFGGTDPVGYGEVVCFSEQRARELPISVVRWVASRPPAGIAAWAHFSSVIACDPGWAPAVRACDDRSETTGGSVVVAPGASASSKTWPLERWFALVADLRNAGVPCVVVGGPLEPWAEFRPDLPDLIAVFSRARAFVGPDSGPAHLARRLGVPSWVVFTDSERLPWCPHGGQAVFRETEIVAGLRELAGS